MALGGRLREAFASAPMSPGYYGICYVGVSGVQERDIA